MARRVAHPPVFRVIRVFRGQSPAPRIFAAPIVRIATAIAIDMLEGIFDAPKGFL
jgi:hypothetical protein